MTMILIEWKLQRNARARHLTAKSSKLGGLKIRTYLSIAKLQIKNKKLDATKLRE
jgi:hypothetical protein